MTDTAKRSHMLTITIPTGSGDITPSICVAENGVVLGGIRSIQITSPVSRAVVYDYTNADTIKALRRHGFDVALSDKAP